MTHSTPRIAGLNPPPGQSFSMVKLVVLGLLTVAVASGGPSKKTVACDIVVAGGSTASLAAAITAAEASPALTVCFTEITDWPGGQVVSQKPYMLTLHLI